MASTAASEPSKAAAFDVRLQSITYAAKDALLFEFSAQGDALSPARPGAHLDLHLPSGLRRQYSLVTPLCSPKSYIVAVKREQAGRGGSIWLHDEARVGTTLKIGPPRNTFALDEQAEATLLLAGGIGITPIFAMFMRLQELGRRVKLHYWSRSPEHVLFRDQLQNHPDVTLYDSSRLPRVAVGDVLQDAQAATEIYCCGPARMIDECVAHAPNVSRLHVERFASSADSKEGAAAGFSVHLARSGLDIEVAAGETILNALIAAGVDVPYSCEEGVCGACETKLLEGAPLHKDSVRSPEDHDRLGTFMICCSLTRGKRLVLDI